MGAVEHLKTLCRLGLKPQEAMIAVTPLLHAIIPHGWTRIALMEPDATPVQGMRGAPLSPNVRLSQRVTPWAQSSISRPCAA